MVFIVSYSIDGTMISERHPTATAASARVSVLLAPPRPPLVFIRGDDGADYDLHELTTLSQQETGKAQASQASARSQPARKADRRHRDGRGRA
jgi:hypothetical protein